MRLYFSPKVSIVGLILISLMVRASFWQADRYQQKLDLIAAMQQRLKVPVVDLKDLLKSSPDWKQLTYRRVKVSGEFDFSKEVTIRNRSIEQEPGVHLITPFKLDQLGVYILVNRGFIPLHLAQKDRRQQFEGPARREFTALVKESSYQKFLAPQDSPAGAGLPWNDSWLRVDLPAMGKQLPYPILPIYLEMLPSDDFALIEQQFVKSNSGKEELLVPGFRAVRSGEDTQQEIANYPLPAYDTVIPAGRHYQYIFEWAFMALLTLLICLVLQMRPKKVGLEIDIESQKA